MIDGGTTTPYVHRNLTQIKNLTIVSNSAALAAELSLFQYANIYLTGGFLRRTSLSLVGEVAENTVERFRANKAILGIDGISVARGLTTINFLEAGVKKKMLSSCEQLIIVADYSKIEKVCLVPVTNLEEVSILVTDSKAPKELIDRFIDVGIEVIVANI